MDPARLSDLAMSRCPGTLPASVRSALDVLCRSLREDARLTPLATRPVEQLIVSGLVARLRLDARVPADARPRTPPLIVCGLPRSGTTLLHRLLALSEGARAVPFWELHAPVPGVEPDHRRRDARAALGWLHLSGASALRPMREDLPDECGLLLRLGLRTQLFWALAPVHGYLDWLLDEPPPYAVYRRTLAHLEGLAPGRLVLKYPAHALHLPALLEALPGAQVVVTHRDPDDVLPSSHHLLLGLHARVSDDVDVPRCIAANTRRLALQAERTAAHASHACVHVAHRALVGDPVGTVGSVHEQLGLEPPDRARLCAFVEANPRPPRTAARAQVPGFEAYRDQFAGFL